MEANLSSADNLLSKMADFGLSRWIHRNGIAAIVIVSYVFMALLVIEQGRTIENQKTLIHQLFSDSLELNAAKMRAIESARHH